VSFSFALPTAIELAPGALDQLGANAARLGTRACLVTGARALAGAGVLDRVTKLLAERGVTAIHQSVEREPDTTLVDRGAEAARAAGCDLVIAIGGGSALDAGKAIACLAANRGEALDYLEVVGRGRSVECPSLPMIAVPTTAGTGSEVTHNAVLADPATRTKASLRHPSLAPRVALLDPLLTLSMPADVTARTGLDALIQLIEPYVSRRSQPIIDALALDGIRRAAAALPRVWHDPGDADARESMMIAALYSGIALSHCGLGAAHAFAGPLGGSYPIPHGIACAAVMPHVMAANLQAATELGDARTVGRFADVAVAIGVDRPADVQARAQAAVRWMAELCRALAVPGLASFGVTRAAFPDLVARARRTSSMRANPVDLDDPLLTTILEHSLEPRRPALAGA
jgi:alcohol dehydrogenase class IV